MNPNGVPIQKSNQISSTNPSSPAAIPVPCPPSQSFPYTVSPALSILSNNHSPYADDQISLPTFAGASSGEVGEIIQTTIRNRKKRVFWTEEEHCNFLSGVQLYGKGRWKMIAQQAVKTRTPSQVASHAQKYFIRQNSSPDKRKRSSIHDVTIPDVISMSQMNPVAFPIGHPASFSQQQPQHAMEPTVQPPAPVESQALPSTSYGQVPTNDDQFEDLLYMPEWIWSSRFD